MFLQLRQREMQFLIVDQFDICREGMKMVLLQMDKKSRVLDVSSIDECKAILSHQELDLIIINLDVAEVDCMDMLGKIKELNMVGNVIVFSDSEDSTVIQKAYNMGISAFIRRQLEKEIMISVFQIVLAGGRYFLPELIDNIKIYKKWPSIDGVFTNEEDRTILSERQLEVLKLLAEGDSNKIIARELNIAAGTVKAHIAGILKSLKVVNRTQAVNVAKNLGILN